MSIEKFEIGKWYRYTGGAERPKEWSPFGYMDAMLDGAPHKVVRVSPETPFHADFEQDPRWSHYDGDERHDTWYWAPNVDLQAKFEEVLVPFIARKRVLIDGEEVAVKIADESGCTTIDGVLHPWSAVSERSVKHLPSNVLEGTKVTRYTTGRAYIFTGRKESYSGIAKAIQTYKSYFVTTKVVGEEVTLLNPTTSERHTVRGQQNLFRDVTDSLDIPKKTCAHCGKTTLFTEVVAVGGAEEDWCQECIDSDTATCLECGARHVRREMENLEDDQYLCNLHRGMYVRCSDCGELIRRADAIVRGQYTYCAGCVHIVHDYNFKPNPNFIGTGPRYYGMELEMENTSGTVESWLYDHSEEESLYYLKHDGSLRDGFEVVTHPMSAAAFQEKKPFWEELSAYVAKQGMRSHETGRCGLHFHVSRKGLGSNDAERERTITRIVYLYEKYFTDFLKLSRRTEQQLSEWARRYLEGRRTIDENDVKEAVRHGKDKYRAINLMPPQTIEFRLFRGTLNIDSLLASLQLVDNWINVAMSGVDIKAVTIQDILTQTAYPELTVYAKERGVE